MGIVWQCQDVCDFDIVKHAVDDAGLIDMLLLNHYVFLLLLHDVNFMGTLVLINVTLGFLDFGLGLFAFVCYGLKNMKKWIRILGYGLWFLVL